MKALLIGLALALSVAPGCADRDDAGSSSNLGAEGGDASGNLPGNCTGSASDYICSVDGLHNWAADAGCTAGGDEGYQQDRQTYVASLNYVRDDGAMWKNFDGPTTITLSLLKEDLKLYIEALLKLDPRLPPSGSIWPGVQFKIEGGASSILQPVLWMGGNFSVPDKDGNLPSYVGVYSSSGLLSDPDLDTDSFEEAGSNFWQPEMRLHWWDQRTPEEPMEWLCVAINGDNGDDHCPSDGPTFFAMLNWAAQSSFPLVNSQYVVFDDTLVPGGQVVEYDQISRDIYVVNDNMDVELELKVPAQGAVLSQSPIEIKSTLTPLDGDQTAATSILNVSKLLNVNQSSAKYEFTDATPGWSWANSYIQRFFPFVFEDFVNGSSKEECEDRIQETIGALSVFQNLGVHLTTSPSSEELPDPQMD